jgi:hypothetical protein
VKRRRRCSSIIHGDEASGAASNKGGFGFVFFVMIHAKSGSHKCCDGKAQVFSDFARKKFLVFGFY